MTKYVDETNISNTKCLQSFSEVYTQIECTLTPENLKLQNIRGIKIALCFIIIAIFFNSTIYYSQIYESLREKKYDLNNINLSDYSVQMVITP